MTREQKKTIGNHVARWYQPVLLTAALTLMSTILWKGFDFVGEVKSTMINTTNSVNSLIRSSESLHRRMSKQDAVNETQTIRLNRLEERHGYSTDQNGAISYTFKNNQR